MCYHGDTNGQDYTGTMSVNEDGVGCQRWDSMYPNDHSYVLFAGGENISEAENYCRNPTTNEKPWCYHLDQDGWAYCGLSECVGK